MGLEAEVVLAAQAELGEGPVWDRRTGQLLWVDILAGEVHRFEPVSGKDVKFVTGQPVGFVVPRASGGVVVGLRDGLAVVDGDWEHLEFLVEIEADDPGTRMNDGKCDPAGRLWAGTMDFGSGPGSGSLYRVNADWTVTKVLDGVSCSNGLGWSLDGRLMYYIDSGTNCVDVMDYDLVAGNVSDRRHFVRIADSEGTPDGMTVDSEGFLWVAIWGGSAVRRYAPDGTLERVVTLPASQTSSCEFGGSELADLYITSAYYELSLDQLALDPHAGALFRLKPDVIGRPSTQFRG